ncbi:MAG TPA: NADH-quinone oxidoreductase subunit A [candidate division Zixibacteria bacterium]|nr:NADH-quinone oxidoreductase subunit A [candidate division Zixibacteria bacterium]
MFQTFYPILLLLTLAVILASAFVVMSIIFGRRTRLGKKNEPYECGVEPVGTTRDPVHVKFYMVAILFILFDIEVIFLYPWAVISRKLGMFGFFEMIVFVIILLVGYFYILGRGALRWD